MIYYFVMTTFQPYNYKKKPLTSKLQSCYSIIVTIYIVVL